MKRAKKKRAAPAVWMPWQESFFSFFRMVDRTWTPPAKMRACAARGHNTVTGRFVSEDGLVFTATSRLEEHEGRLVVVESGLRTTLRTRAK